MSSNLGISPAQLSRLIGLPTAPVLIDVRIDEDYAADPRLVPGSCRRDFRTVATWSRTFIGRDVVIICQRGQKLSQGVAAYLRHDGIAAESLDGGFEAWRDGTGPNAGGMLVKTDNLPTPDAEGRTVWVTRTRPKIDRIACPWLIRRFIDPKAVFLFVAAREVSDVADRFNATAFDSEGVFWTHRGDDCTFDMMLDTLGLASGPLAHLATIVRGADTGRLDLAPEAAGLLAASLGLSRLFKDDLQQLDAGMMLYDALYRWCRDATTETHNWPSSQKSA